MRTKEDAHDYRYFPDPDLMPFEPTEAWLEAISRRVVELPLARKQRFMRDYQLPATDAQAFVWDLPLGNYFEEVAKQSKNPKSAANWVINNLRAKLAEANRDAVLEQDALGISKSERKGMSLTCLKFPPSGIVELVELVDRGTISNKIAQEVFEEMFRGGESPAKIVEQKGLVQVSDTAALEKFCEEVINANPGPAGDFRGGKAPALNFLKGQVMKLSKGKANPALVGEILERKLKG
jgi:aspartyl-tRNA(Asn)/glutamyl-tRNA(Gln) amidotransferase subunit B